MSKRIKYIGTALIYLLVLIITILIGRWWINRDLVTVDRPGETQSQVTVLPKLYVRSGGDLINPMTAYTVPVDGGRLRDSLTPVSNSNTINLMVVPGDYPVESISYELMDSTGTTQMESGTLTILEVLETEVSAQVTLGTGFQEGAEYCLNLTVNTQDETSYYYYTRVKCGAQLRVAEKVKFAKDFNQLTFSADSAYNLNNYIETSTDKSNSDFREVTIQSNLSSVTWGDMHPALVTEPVATVKEINTEMASIQLDYSVSVMNGQAEQIYAVTEFLKIRWTYDKVYLLDYTRTMDQILSTSQLEISGKNLNLGMIDTQELSLTHYGTEETDDYVAFVANHRLWMYQQATQTITEVYGPSLMGSSLDTLATEPYGIHILRTEEDGSLFFMVYGYIHDLTYYGQQGRLMYHYNNQDNTLERLLFLPSDKNYQLQKLEMEQLAYMNSAGELYLFVDDSIYLVDYTSGNITPRWTNLRSEDYVISQAEHMLIMVEGGASETLQLVDLESGQTTELRGNGKVIRPLGFFCGDFVYGLADSALITTDDKGGSVVPMDTLRIVTAQEADTSNYVMEYQKEGAYIMNVSMNGQTLTLDLSVPGSVNGGQTYEVTEKDYILSNKSVEEDVVVWTNVFDQVFRDETHISLPFAQNGIPLTRRALVQNLTHSIQVDYEWLPENEVKYDLYAQGRLKTQYVSVRAAIEAANEQGGTVLGSNKALIWQWRERSEEFILDIQSITRATTPEAMGQAIINALHVYEGTGQTMGESVEGNLYQAMETQLERPMIDLTGVDMENVLYFIYKGKPVVARNGADSYCLLVGYTTYSVIVANPATGTVDHMDWDSARDLFEANGNVFYSY